MNGALAEKLKQQRKDKRTLAQWPDDQVPSVQVTWERPEDRFEKLQRWSDRIARDRDAVGQVLRQVLFMLPRFNSQDGGFWYSRDTVAEVLQTDRRRISEGRAWMVRRGYLKRRWERPLGLKVAAKVAMYFPSLPINQSADIPDSLTPVTKTAKSDMGAPLECGHSGLKSADIPHPILEDQRGDLRGRQPITGRSPASASIGSAEEKESESFDFDDSDIPF
jgi:hypothetical protein